MATVTLSSVVHPVFNEFDDLGILLGIERLKEESNAAYKKRIEDVFVHRADSTYMGLIYGITRELGLALFSPLSVVTTNANAVLKIEDTWCVIYSDYSLGDAGISIKLDLFKEDSTEYTLAGLESAINLDGTFTASLSAGIDGALRSRTIFNQSNLKEVLQEDIFGKGEIVNLRNKRLLDSTVSVSSLFLTERVASPVAMKNYQYYINLDAGLIHCGQVPELGASINYESQDLSFKFLASPVIISKLQSEGLMDRLFDRIVDSNQVPRNQNLTLLGTEVMNELLSVYPYLYGV